MQDADVAHDNDRIGYVTNLVDCPRSNHQDLRHAEEFTQIDVPGASFTVALSINREVT